MAKFNSKAAAVKDKPDTVNLAGGKAYTLSDKMELVTLLATSFLSGDKVYEKQAETVKRLQALIKQIPDKEFIAKASVYTRDKLHLRSVSHIIAGELALAVKGEEWTKDYFNKIVFRVDDMAEILSYYFMQAQTKNNKKRPVPNALKKGFAKAIGRFDAYQLGKYRGEGKGVKLVDIVNLVHPKPTERNGNVKYDRLDLDKIREATKPDSKTYKLVTRIMAQNTTGEIPALTALSLGLLKNTDTWEAKISNAGQAAKTKIAENNLTEQEAQELKDDLKGEEWKELILNKKIGYFALLRNLKNIMEQAPDIVDKTCELLVDPNLISKSRVLPFRFLTAYKMLDSMSYNKKASKVLTALSTALDLSVANVPVFDGETLVVLDISGSMRSAYIKSNNPKNPRETTCGELGAMFASVLLKANPNSELLLFDTTAKFKPVNRGDSTITLTKYLNFNGGGTDFKCIFKSLKNKYDRIIILSDMQGWVGHDAPTKEFKAYKDRTGATPYVYSFDLSGYGTSQFPEAQVTTLAGFSDQVFAVMKNSEIDKTSMLQEIENISLL